MKIGANIPSMRASNNMSKAYASLGRSTARLSSGIKISKSSDDPSGLAIGNKINLQTKGLSQANENSANGVSLLQTAEGALNQMHEILQRIRELSIKAANDTNATDDRNKIQNEINQLIQEVNSISSKTEYNKIKLLNGEAGRIIKPKNPASKQAEILNISPNLPFGDINIGVMSRETSFSFLPDSTKINPVLSTFAGQNLNINNINITIEPNETENSLYTKLQTALEQTGFKAIKGTGGKVFDEISAHNSGSKQNLIVTGNKDLISAIGMEGFLQGQLDYSTDPPTPYIMSPTATFPTLGTDSKVTIATGTTFTPNVTYTADGGKIIINDLGKNELRLNLNDIPSGSTINYTTKKGPVNIQVGANKDMGMNVDIPKINSEMLGLDEVNVMTADLAENSITIADNSVNMISDTRSRLGAYLNGLESVIANLDNAEVDSKLSYSRIMDTDMAEEMAEYSKNNIIYEAGTAILAQSNMRPQSILQLIQ